VFVLGTCSLTQLGSFKNCMPVGLFKKKLKEKRENFIYQAGLQKASIYQFKGTVSRDFRPSGPLIHGLKRF
jgi:hypothetical protein